MVLHCLSVDDKPPFRGERGYCTENLWDRNARAEKKELAAAGRTNGLGRRLLLKIKKEVNVLRIFYMLCILRQNLFLAGRCRCFARRVFYEKVSEIKYVMAFRVPQVVVLSVLLLAVPALVHAAGRILFPPADVWLTGDSLRLVGRSDSQTGEVTLRLKQTSGQSELRFPVENGVFSGLVSLDSGLNELQLVGEASEAARRRVFRAASAAGEGAPAGFVHYHLHSKGDAAENCSGCHERTPEGAMRYDRLVQDRSCSTASCHPNFLRQKYPHSPLEGGSCAGCHNPHGTSSRFFLKAERAALCYSCHDMEQARFDQEHQHFPVRTGECVACHDPHQSDFPFHLKRGSIAGVCSGCHPRSTEKFAVPHEPFREGDCIACHDPHASRHANLQYEDKSEMCFQCHEDRRQELELRYVHKPMAEDCKLCHDPHGSAIEFHLRTLKDGEGRYLTAEKPIAESCLVCHRKLDPEVSAAIEGARVPHKPVAEKKCTTCHTPHSSDFPKLLRGPLDTLCFPCHAELKKQIENSAFLHGPVRQKDCAKCHAVHGSDSPGMLIAPFSAEYSSDFKEESYALCYNCHLKDVYLDRESMATGFRNGRQNLHFLHVNTKDGRGCMACHEIHASNQEFHLRETIPFKKRFTISLKFTRGETGGGCVVGCHKPREYDRENPAGAR